MAKKYSNLDTLLNKINDDTGLSEAEEILKLQSQRQLRAENKRVSQMTDLEKQMYAEMEQKNIAEYERKQYKEEKPLTYSGEYMPFFSPIASTVLDAFFTDGEN